MSVDDQRYGEAMCRLSWPVLTVLPMALACGGGGASAPPHGANTAEVAAAASSGFSSQTQTVGQAADGLTLRSVRHAAHDGFYRIVFDVGLAEGAAAEVVPFARAELRGHDKSVVLQIDGIRHDLTGNKPLRTEAGDAFGSPIPVDRPPVSYVARELVLDDSSVVYRVQLMRRAQFRLHALPNPARVILDIENTGGAH